MLILRLASCFCVACLFSLVYAQWQDYQDPRTGFRVRIPVGWQYSPPDDPAVLAYFESETHHLTIACEDTSIAFASSVTYNNILNNARQSFEEGLRSEVGTSVQSCNETGRKIHEVGGLMVATLDLLSVVDGTPLQTRIRMLLADNRLYSLIITAEQSDFIQNEALIDQIFDSAQPKDPSSQRRLSVGAIVATVVGCAVCSLAGLGGLTWLIIKLVKKSAPTGGGLS